MLSSLTSLIALVAAIFAGLWGRQKWRNLKADRDRIQATHVAINQAGRRLEEARKAPVTPIDTKQRRDFEQQP